MTSVNELKDLVSNLGIKVSSALEEQLQKSRVNDAFKKDKEEFTKIIKTLFETNTIDCNVLKKAGEALKTQVCANSFDVEDQDYFVQNVICHEIFTIASMDEFCPNLVLNHIDEL